MVINSQCYPCFLRQVISTCHVVGASENHIKRVLRKVMAVLSKADDSVPPPYLSRDVYNIISEELGVDDPYKEIKKESNRKALNMYSSLKKLVEESEDGLFEAVRIAVIGNIIDFGASQNFRLEDLPSFKEIPFAVNDYSKLKSDLAKANKVLYIGDNAGEIVFDKVLVELLVDMGKEVFFAVRSKPIINDATMEDALEVGMNEVAEVIDSGSDAPGIVVDRVTNEFKHLFRDAHVVISKGQGNFETLEDIPRTVYFLLRAKCSVVADILGANIGDMVIYKGGSQCHGLLL